MLPAHDQVASIRDRADVAENSGFHIQIQLVQAAIFRLLPDALPAVNFRARQTAREGDLPVV